MTPRVIFLILLILFSSAEAFPFTSPVVGVIDGNTIDILHNGKAQRIRLYGIDCPEKGQPFGKVAKWATSALVFGRTVTVQGHDKDKYKRLVADVLLADGTNVNQKLVKDGWCWWYQKYAPDDVVLEALEQEARGMKRGLWVDPRPLAPWQWRKRSKVMS